MMKQLVVRGMVIGLMAASGTAMAADKAAKPAKASNGDNYLLGKVSEDANQFITLTTENDKFGPKSIDRHYTNGFRANYFTVQDQPHGWVQAIGDVMPFLDVGGQTGMSYSLGHEIYTPDNVQRAATSPGDMPYSGFFYGKMGFTTYKPFQTDSYELTAGVVGPAAEGKFVQRAYHDITGIYKPQGWDFYHLENEPILNFSWLRRHPGALAWEGTMLGSTWFADFEPRYGFAVGNAHDYVNTGATVRFGPATARFADTPLMMTHGLPGSGYFAKSPNWFDWYVFASADGRVVGRNIFLDGNTFRNSPSVGHRPLVGDLAAGVVLLFGPVKGSFALNQRSKEFDTQPHTDVFGAFNVGYAF